MSEHHYLPQFYQRRWANDGEVFVYQRPYKAVIVDPKPTKATGKVQGLYTTPTLPPERAEELETKFWKTIDQWGSDGISVLESSDPSQATKLLKDRWATFMMSLLFRNPQQVERINKAAEAHYRSSRIAQNYQKFRRPHEPDNYEEFIGGLQKPGISEFGAQILRAFTLNEAIRTQLLAMSWHVVAVTNTPMPLLTSDNPIIRYKGLKEPDGLLMLPLGPKEFFVAFNEGSIDMKQWINESISHGHFIEGMNKYVVQHAVRYVYGSDGSQVQFVEQFLPIEPMPIDPIIPSA